MLVGMWFEVAHRAFSNDAKPQNLGALVLARRTIDRLLPGLWPWCPWCAPMLSNVTIQKADALIAVEIYFGDPRATEMAMIGFAWANGDYIDAKNRITKLTNATDRTWAESVPIIVGIHTDDNPQKLELHDLVIGIYRLESKIEQYFFTLPNSVSLPLDNVTIASDFATGMIVGWHATIFDIWGNLDPRYIDDRKLLIRIRMILEMHAPGLCVGFRLAKAIGAQKPVTSIEIKTPAECAQYYRAYLGFNEHAENAARGYLFGAVLVQERLDPLNRLPAFIVKNFLDIPETKKVIDMVLTATSTMRALDDVQPDLIMKTSFDLHTACMGAIQNL